MTSKTPKETQFEELAGMASPDQQRGLEIDNGGIQSESSENPVPVDPKLKEDAAKKVFREGVLHRDQGADEAMARLPHINVPKK